MRAAGAESSPSRRYAAALVIALAAGAVIRLWFRVGFVGGFPQDDGIYVNLGRLLADHVDLVARYRDLPAAYAANPAELFAFRIAFIYPLSWCFRLFGEGDGPATLPGILSALVSIWAVAEIARTVAGRRAGAAAAVLLALLPYDVLLTTRVLSDGPLRMFVALALLAALRGWATLSPILFGLCGLMLAGAYITKMPGATLFVLLAVPLAVRSVRAGSYGALAAYGGAFGSVLLAETLWYWSRTGEFLLHYRIVRSAILSKLAHEPVAVTDVGRYLRLLWEGEFMWYAPLALGLERVGYYEFGGFGMHGWLWVGGLYAALRRRTRLASALAAIGIGMYLFVECFPLDVRISEGRLHYALVYRQWRFLSLLTPAGVPLAGVLVAGVSERSRAAAGAVLVACLMTGWTGFLDNYSVFRGSQTDLREAASFLDGRSEVVYADALAGSTLRYFLSSHDRARQLRDVSALREFGPDRGALVVTGGQRSIELLAEVWEKDLPAWCRAAMATPDAPPAGWRVVHRVRGPHDLTRLHDLLILQYIGEPLAPLTPVSSSGGPVAPHRARGATLAARTDGAPRSNTLQSP